MLRLALLFALALVVRESVTVVASPPAVYEPRLFSASDLLQYHHHSSSSSSSADFASVLQTTGILQISLEEDLSLDFEHILERFCQCAPALSSTYSSQSKADHHHHDDDPIALVQRLTLADGQTTRTTLGSATIGRQPLPLPKELQVTCGSDVVQELETLRDQVAVAANAFQVALDALLLQEQRPKQMKQALLKTSYGTSYSTIQEITHAANHLEHFHVYSKPPRLSTAEEEHNVSTSSSSSPVVLEWHTDAGLFLAFVPGQNCEQGASSDIEHSSSFWIVDPSDQQEKPVQFHPRAVVVMLGVGAEHWLQTNVPLRATKHAVRMQPGQVRAWYGMMHLVPESAIIQKFPERTFGDMRQNMVYAKDRIYTDDDDTSVIAVGCGNDDGRNDKDKDFLQLTATRPSTIERRRLQHVQEASACNNSTNFFCWMQCLDIPDAKEAQGYLNEGYSLYCLDPSILVSSSNRVSSATEQCENGYVHNANCLGSWQPTAPNVQAIPVQVDSSYEAATEQWCYGGTSMYMDGFHWRDTVCVIFLFPQWVLTSRAKVAGASIGTILLGVTLEKTIHHRRFVVTTMEAGYRRLGVSALMYGLQLTMGYLLMLILMTYSGPFFISVVLGLVIGHVFFNAKDAVLLQRNKGGCAVKECAPECAQNCAAAEEDDVIKACPCNELTEGDNADVPEGSTPCCQNTL